MGRVVQGRGRVGLATALVAVLVLSVLVMDGLREPAKADQSTSTRSRVAAASITAGDRHTCVLTVRGRVRCWGENDYGQLGYGDTAAVGDDEVPAVAGNVRLGGVAVAVSAGRRHTCALLRSGRVRCWGDNAYGQLGYGNTTTVGDDETPADAGDIRLGRRAVAISAGGNHTCAVLGNGRVRCWGDNRVGQLGYGNDRTIGNDETPASVGPVLLGGRATAIDAGDQHTCALLGKGRVRCWGWGASGRLGYGNTENVGDDENPADVGDIALGGTAVAVSAGSTRTCAVLVRGGVRCWGSGNAGVLGYGNTDNVGDDETPADVGNIRLGGRGTQVAAGGRLTCAGLAAGTVRCWGDGNLASGYGSTEYIGDDESPADVGDIDLGRRVAGLAVGGRHACAVLITGRVRCWGYGPDGELGYGTPVSIGNDETPARAGTVVVGGPVEEVAAGDAHTCVLRDTGGVRCWGYANLGQLGYGNTTWTKAPNGLGDVPLGGRAAAIAIGSWHGCALLDTGAVRCWGQGQGGKLGYGNTENVGNDETPASVGDIDLGGTATAVTAGDKHTCALLDTGSVRCWGQGQGGKLGYGNTESIGDDETPASVGDIDLGGTATAVTAGDQHTCALLQSGSVRCWGDGSAGQLGYGNTDSIGDNESPASVGDVDLGGRAVAIGAGTAHTCALLQAGTVRCWGEGARGRLGYGSVDRVGDDETPASVGDVPVGGTVAAISVRGERTCALLTSGRVRCWGGYGGWLGYGSTRTIGDDETPASAGTVRIGGRSTAIGGGWNHTCAVLVGGWVRCWGVGGLGQLGYGSAVSVGDNETPFVPDIQVGARVRTKGSPRLRSRAHPWRDRTAPYRFRITGSLASTAVHPFQPDAAVCGGVVRLVVRARTKRVAAVRTRVRDDCSYARSFRVAFTDLPRPMRRRIRNTDLPGHLLVVVRYAGTTNLTPARKRLRVRVG